ncbi:MAG: hypothetical protein A2V88_08560 [Elusimicrobia bacterium RBG_16_66_12]|nr:MAG: hypothetical protein A2V88_08560 [Elusimicrobia bacterium RBG_16_66_12]
MDEAGLDALIATSAANVQYLTRFRRAGGALAVLPRGDLKRPQLIVKSSSISFSLEDPCDQVGVHVYGNFIRFVAEGVGLTDREARLLELHNASRQDADPWTLAAEILTAAGLHRGGVGVDAVLESVSKLSAALPELKLKSTPDLFRRLRMVKTAEEISRLAEAARITEHAILTSVQSAFLGVTQRGLARVFDHTAIEANSFVRQDNVSIGRSAAFGNLNTPGDVVADGDIIRYDVGVHYEGYASDMARCYAFRTADDRAVRIQAALVEGERALLDAVRPGVTAAQIFDVAVGAVRKAGIEAYDRTHVGHGIGIAGAGYDPPLLAPSDHTPLEPGIVLCVETPYVEIGFAGLQVEDMIVVTEDGYRLMTNSARHLRVVP